MCVLICEFIIVIYIYIYICKVKLATIVEGNSKAPFPIATTPRGRDGRKISRAFANGHGDWGSIPGRVIPKTKKGYLMPHCLTLSILR